MSISLINVSLSYTKSIFRCYQYYITDEGSDVLIRKISINKHDKTFQRAISFGVMVQYLIDN